MVTGKWDGVPVWGVWQQMPGETPMTGNVRFSLSQRITRTDGRVIYPEGASVTAVIGNADQQNPTVRAAVRAAWRGADETALGGDFDGLAWDEWWDTKILPAAVFTMFPAADDPDIVQQDWQVVVTEQLQAGGKSYAIQPLLAHLSNPIPGVNLNAVEVPPNAPNVQPVYAKGIAGGVAALDADGDVVDANGDKVVGGGGGGVTDYNDLENKPTLGTAASQNTSAFATAAQGAKADTAVQPAALSAYAADSAVVKVTGNQTIAGVKTFSSAPVVPDAAWTIGKTSGLQAALDAKIPAPADPNADRILFWDDSAGTFTWLTVGTGLTITGTTITATGTVPLFAYYNGTSWGARPTGSQVGWISTLYPDAPRPSAMEEGDFWIEAPPAPEEAP